MAVLDKLVSLLSFACKGCVSVVARGRIILGVYEVAKFLVTFKFLDNRKIFNKAKSYVSRSRGHLWDAIFPSGWGTSVVENLSGLRKNGFAKEILNEVLVDNIKPKNGHLSHKQVGMIAKLFLVTGKLDDEQLKRISMSLPRLHSWGGFLKSIKNCVGSGYSPSLILDFHKALRSSIALDWRRCQGYIPPDTFLFLVERLVFMTSACRTSEPFITTKASVVDDLSSEVRRGFEDSSLVMPHLEREILESTYRMVENLLDYMNDIKEWMRITSVPCQFFESVVMRLVCVLCLVALYTRRDMTLLANMILRPCIILNLPTVFSRKLCGAAFYRPCDRDHFIRIFAEALAAVGNQMVVFCNDDHSLEFMDSNAIFITWDKIICREDIIPFLFRKTPQDASVDGVHATRTEGNHWAMYLGFFDMLEVFKSKMPKSFEDVYCEHALIIINLKVAAESVVRVLEDAEAAFERAGTCDSVGGWISAMLHHTQLLLNALNILRDGVLDENNSMALGDACDRILELSREPTVVEHIERRMTLRLET